MTAGQKKRSWPKAVTALTRTTVQDNDSCLNTATKQQLVKENDNSQTKWHNNSWLKTITAAKHDKKPSTTKAVQYDRWPNTTTADQTQRQLTKHNNWPNTTENPAQRKQSNTTAIQTQRQLSEHDCSRRQQQHSKVQYNDSSQAHKAKSAKRTPTPTQLNNNKHKQTTTTNSRNRQTTNNNGKYRNLAIC